MVRELVARGARVALHPCTSSAAELLAEDPDAVFLSNGPGDPAALGYVVETVRADRRARSPCGASASATSCCAARWASRRSSCRSATAAPTTPSATCTTGRVEITSQNHGFAALGPGGGRTIDDDEPVRWETDFGAAALSHVNLYDRTVEGLELLDVPGGTVQYHPEAGPGPHDSLYLFDRFLERIGSAA